jgi:hypothetical protein
MYDVFKKHILRKERYLLPTLNGAKKIRINEKDYDNFKEVIKDFDKSLFQLPRDITCFELKRNILLLIDQFKNQKGYDKNRKIIIFIKVKSDKEAENYFTYLNVKREQKDNEKLSGVALLSFLLGLRYSEETDNQSDVERVKSMSEVQKRAISFCFENNDVYLKFSLEATGDHIKIDNVFYIVTKKTSLKVDFLEYTNECMEQYLYKRITSLVQGIYNSVIYYNLSIAERREE